MSKRSRSGETSEPFCATWSPSTSRSASCSRWVAEWLARVAARAAWSTRELQRGADGERPLLDLDLVDDEIAELLLGVEHARAQARSEDQPDVADLAARLAVERRLVEDEPAALARASEPTSAPSRTIAPATPSAVSVA